MNLLLLLQGASTQDQPGFHDAFLSLERAGVLSRYAVLPYRTPSDNSPRHWEGLYRRALDIVADEHIDAIILQWFHGPLADPRPFLAAARRIRPELLVVTTCGDPYGRWLQRPPASLLEAASASDLNLITAMGGTAAVLAAHGARNLALMPHGACQLRFSQAVSMPKVKDFDVVFIGSNNGGRNPFTPLSRAGRKRLAMVLALEKRYGRRFGLFGKGWEGHLAWNGPVPYEQQHAVAARARLQVGGFPGATATYYASDRPFIAMASGTPLLDCHVDRMDKLAVPGRHWGSYHDLPSLMRAVDQALERPGAELQAWGSAARELVLERHLQSHRAREMVDLVASMRTARSRGIPMAPPALRCFAPGVDPLAEQPFAIRSWTG